MQKKNLSFCFFIIFLVGTIQAQTPSRTEAPIPTTRILFVFDASLSMIGYWEERTKIEVARSILIPFLDSVSKIPNTEIALRVYGNRSPVPPQDCNDTHLEVPFGKQNIHDIIKVITEVEPKGTTPIAHSLLQAADDFPKDSTARNIIFLLTDGIEACDGDPCAISRELQKKGAILKPFIIGVGNEINFNEVFNCAGTVFSANSESEFGTILHAAMKKASTSTPLQVFLLDIHNRPVETNIPMTFYDNTSGYIRYNFIHSEIKPAEPDIIFVDPVPTYKIKVHTKPPVFSDSIVLEAGKHTITRIPVPQGTLLIEAFSTSSASSTTACIVRKSNSMHTLYTQQIRERVRYIVGTYDLEIFTLPRTYFYDVHIKPDQTTTIKIPQPGKLSISRTKPGYGAIFVDRNTELEFVVALDENPKGNESFMLQPGKYILMWRDKKETDTEKSIYENFEIRSGEFKFIQLK